MWVVGIDASLRGLGLAALVADDAVRLDTLRTATYSRPLPDDASPDARAERLDALSSDVEGFLHELQPSAKQISDFQVVQLYIEGYAFSKRTTATTRLAELGGVLRCDLWRYTGAAPREVAVNSARKLLLGKLPRKDHKARTAEVVARVVNGRCKTEHEVDAFVVANYGLYLLGRGFYALPPPIEETNDATT